MRDESTTGSSEGRGVRRRLSRAARQWAMVTVSALIMVVTSERVFWYYADAAPAGFAELAVFYSLAVFALFWFCHRYRVDGWWSLVAAVPVFGYVVEGVITPVLYSGGPTPVFPLWFSAWHGGLGVLVAWYGLRRLLIAGRVGATLALVIALGVFWGTWATTMWLPENLNDPELVESAPRIRSLADFARYASLTTLFLAAGHGLLGRVWVPDYRPSPLVARLLGGLCLTMVVAYTVALPWAAPMFVGLLALVAWVLRGRRGGPPARPDLFATLAGRVSPPALVTVAALPVAATATHGLWLAIDPSLTAIRTILYGTIALQSGTAAVALVWSARRLTAERRAVEPWAGEGRPVEYRAVEHPAGAGRSGDGVAGAAGGPEAGAHR